MVRALERAGEVAAVGAGAVDVSTVPSTRLVALARYGVTAKAAALGDLAESRRTATLVAALQSLERTAVDDAMFLWDQVPDGCKVRSVKQFRMRAGIGRAVSRLFYEDGLLQCGPGAGLGLPWPLEREVIWVDTGRQGEARGQGSSGAASRTSCSASRTRSFRVGVHETQEVHQYISHLGRPQRTRLRIAGRSGEVASAVGLGPAFGTTPAGPARPGPRSLPCARAFPIGS
jgi:hypothetical protein